MSGATRIRPARANSARDLAAKMIRPAVQCPIGNRASRFRRRIFKATEAQCELAIKLDRLQPKLGRKVPATSDEHGHPRGAAKVTARQALIG